MKLITEEMDQKLNKTLGHTFRIHSGHDGTIAYAMRALNIYEQISLPNPFYSSALTFELREKDDKHYVTVSILAIDQIYRKTSKQKLEFIVAPLFNFFQGLSLYINLAFI